MIEQEATELIATKLMGWTRVMEATDGDSDCELSNLFVKNLSETTFKTTDGTYLQVGKISIFPGGNWDPFNNSNHARMVKNRLEEAGLVVEYIMKLMEQYLPIEIDPSATKMFSIHNAPDDVCMWAVVNVLTMNE